MRIASRESMAIFVQHTGFNVHTKVRAKTKKEAERVGKYMIRPILSLQRLSFDETEGRILYQYDKGKLETERMDYLEFIGRYYGLCKALHKPYYAEFKIMLSYLSRFQILN